METIIASIFLIVCFFTVKILFTKVKRFDEYEDRIFEKKNKE